MRTGRSCSSLSWLATFLSFLATAASGQEGDTLVHMVRPGVVHRSILDSRGPWQIHILQFDLRRSDLRVESARAHDTLRGRERTSAMVARMGGKEKRVVAAVNADFFDLVSGESVNNQVRNGEIIRAVTPPAGRDDQKAIVRSQIGFRADNSPVLGRLVFDGAVLWPGGRRSILASVNVLRSRTPYVLFTRASGGETPGDSLASGSLELPLRRLARRGDTVFAAVAGRASAGGRLPLSADRLALRSNVHPSMIDSVSPGIGDTVAFVLAFRPPAGCVRSLVGGIPWLVRDGAVISFERDQLEGASMDFATRRHPRTGVGFSRDSTTGYFLTVDGRQSSSVGMSLKEFGELMIAAGVYQGLNLDGGGSTTMVVDGVVVNSPSDAGGERPVANSLLLMELGDTQEYCQEETHP